ncbi:MAG: glycoside hydrolase [Verrucomicrobia bacterium]|nr:glycoside hydrolase [Verrucomicrobiota bacterium]
MGVLYVAYQAYWLGEPRILFTRSPDQGRTWTGPVPVNDTPNQRSVFNAAIAVTPDGQHVSVIFNDKRHDDGSGRWVDVYLAESFDGGLTWKPNLRLTEMASDLQLAP